MRPLGDDKLYAAMSARRILEDVLPLERLTWICRHCGAQTTMLSEICSKCHREDLNQGLRDASSR